MKEYFYEKDNKAYIIDDKKGIIIEDAKDNTEEILIVENNIEKIENILKDTNEKKIVQSYFLKNISKKGKILTIILSVALIIILGLANIYLTGIQMLPMILLSVFMIGFYGIEMFNDRGIKGQIKSCDIYINELEKELEKEKERCKTLKNKSKDKIVDSTIIKKIPKGEIIDNLKRKKELINDYIINNKKYISAYNDNKFYNLFEEGIYQYNENDIEFIKFLIEEDLNTQEKTNEKSKAKKYTNN